MTVLVGHYLKKLSKFFVEHRTLRHSHKGQIRILHTWLRHLSYLFWVLKHSNADKAYDNIDIAIGVQIDLRGFQPADDNPVWCYNN